MSAKIELMNAGGPIAQRLLANGMNTAALRPYVGSDGRAYITVMADGKPKAVPITANATLRRDEWLEIDREVLDAARRRLVGVQDLYSANLVKRVNGMSKTVLEYEDLNEFSAAKMDMDAVVDGVKDRPKYTPKYLPLPIIHKEFGFNSRVLAASRITGDSLDTTAARQAGAVVGEFAENILFNGSSTFTYGGGTIYGYTDHPYRNTVTLAQSWTASGKTGEEILNDVIAMKQANISARHYGPYILYVPVAYGAALDDDFKANSDKSVRSRILEIEGIQGVRVSDFLAADTVVLVEMAPETIRLVEGLPLTTVEWETHGGLSIEYKVMSIMVPQIRADQNNRSGVAVLS